MHGSSRLNDLTFCLVTPALTLVLHNLYKRDMDWQHLVFTTVLLPHSG